MSQIQIGQALLDKYYEERLEFNQEVRDKENELREFKVRRNKETILPLVKFLEERIPSHLKERVLRRFSFKEGDVDGKCSLMKTIEDQTFSCIGMLMLRDIPLTDEELVELNKAWEPVVAIDPQFRSFFLGSSELSREINKRSLDRRLEAGRKASGG